MFLFFVASSISKSLFLFFSRIVFSFLSLAGIAAEAAPPAGENTLPADFQNATPDGSKLLVVEASGNSLHEG